MRQLSRLGQRVRAPTLVVVDYAGHPFTAELCINLAANSPSILYSYCASNATPHGAFNQLEEAGVIVMPVALPRQFHKLAPLRRAVDEWKYAVRTVRQLRRAVEGECELVACQMPLVSSVVLLATCRARRWRFTWWLQDLQSDLVRSRSSRLGAAASLVERWLARRADNVICISESFVRFVEAAGRRGPTALLPNWAPLASLPVTCRDNDWTRAAGLDETTFRVVYSGTLGAKHLPGTIAEIARELLSDIDFEFIVVGGGSGFDSLLQNSDLLKTGRFHLFDFQPLDKLAEVLGGGDVLLATLDPNASEASVPSKLLSYLTAERPVVAVIPEDNPSARLVAETGCGWVVSGPREAVERIRKLKADGDGFRIGASARQYAEQHFDGVTTASAFLRALGDC
jgi:colanic acid biosynthesis glycosyl transferase WcaI